MKKNLFLLGGYDLEMITIRDLLINSGYTEVKGVGDLKDQNSFADRKLKWGASISSYQDLMSFDGNIYGIELSVSDAVSLPKNYHTIDHHNEYSNRDSSLKQVADILGVKLNRHQQLVAANDKGYIPAMKATQASDEEIGHIRKLDRKAQGVTDKDEKLAEESIANHLTKSKGVVIVKSLTSRFSTITDRLFPCNNLLIYTGNELTLYGQNAVNLRDRLPGFKKHNYFGGSPENGFWGLSGIEITQKLINEIIDIAMTEISHHIFLFPFKRIKRKTEKTEKDGNCKILQFLLPFKTKEEEDKNCKSFQSIKLKKVKELKIISNDLVAYNEKKYFHDYAHAALSLDQKGNGKSRFQYSENRFDDLYFKLEVKLEKEKENDKRRHKGLKEGDYEKPKEFITKTYTVRIEKVSLQKNEDGIGLFALHLSNTKHDKPKDILFINQYGRRLFPPFFDLKFEDFNIDDIKHELDGVLYRVLASKISIFQGCKPTEGVSEDWSIFLKPNEEVESYQEVSCPPDDNYIPKHIKYFLEDTKVNIKSIIAPVLDDRMFVMCWYGSEQLNNGFENKRLTYEKEQEEYGFVLSDICKRLTSAYEVGSASRTHDNRKILNVNPGYNGFGYANNDFWYQYLFVDAGSKMCQNPLMQQQLVEDRTYARWVGYNTLYGISRYSFVMLTSSIDQLAKPGINAAFLVDHLKTIYFRMVSLCLLQRSMLLVFDLRASEISQKLNDEKEPVKNDEKEPVKNDEKEPVKNDRKKPVKDPVDEVGKLMKGYTEFLNCVFHREITPQEQGIELYDMLQKHLRIEYQAKELEREIDELHRNTDIISKRKASKAINKITIIGGALLLPTFIASMAQVGLFDFFQTKWGVDFHYWLTQKAIVASADSWWGYIFPHGELTGTILLCALLVFWLYRFYIDQNKEEKKIWPMFWFSSLQFVVFIALYSVLHIVVGFILFTFISALMFGISHFSLRNRKAKTKSNA